MDRADLNAHVRALATLPAIEVPMASCYWGITRGRLARPEAFEGHVRPRPPECGRRCREVLPRS